ncbi:hypothetical protein BH20ACI1_BH20ACI1_22740 [soil metagenome]
MSQTLGEKLRQAREARDITISEVAEQTRISPLYIESIENDDYRLLPGGIFNKGFVKSFAKYVGVDEQEALQDYARLISSQEGLQEEETKTYRPEVLTDDRVSSSSILTIIVAVVILGLMTWGILALVRYIQEQPTTAPVATETPKPEDSNANLSNSRVNANTNSNQAIPATDKINVEFKPIGKEISVEATIDGRRESALIKPDAPKVYDAQESLKFRYYKGFGDKVQLTLNGKPITPPSSPKISGANGIEYEINKENIVRILQSGQITFGDN